MNRNAIRLENFRADLGGRAVMKKYIDRKHG
jgi:hypothetical protein